jgi:hypothetical protein
MPARRITVALLLVLVAAGAMTTLDWLPGAGLVPSHNGSALAAPIRGELLYQLVLRVFVGPSAEGEARARLLGLDR